MSVVKVFRDDDTLGEIQLSEVDSECRINFYPNPSDGKYTSFYLNSMDLLEFIFELQEIKKQIDK